MEATGERVMATLGGASADVWNERDEEPTWQQRTVPSSAAAAKSGSQAREWMLGIPSASGFSEKVTAWQPLAASRLISLAANSASKSGRMPHGMNRSG